jgi:antitoxin (DNA-binding transcriptional repressor) of toxin-antitoxin stability system
MKTLTVREAEGQLANLIKEAHAGNVIVLKDGDKEVWLTPEQPLDPEVDSPELEAELLKAIDGPFTPYSDEEMRRIGERIIWEKQAKHEPAR